MLLLVSGGSFAARPLAGRCDASHNGTSRHLEAGVLSGALGHSARPRCHGSLAQHQGPGQLMQRTRRPAGKATLEPQSDHWWDLSMAASLQECNEDQLSNSLQSDSLLAFSLPYSMTCPGVAVEMAAGHPSAAASGRAW